MEDKSVDVDAILSVAVDKYATAARDDEARSRERDREAWGSKSQCKYRDNEMDLTFRRLIANIAEVIFFAFNAVQRCSTGERRAPENKTGTAFFRRKEVLSQLGRQLGNVRGNWPAYPQPPNHAPLGKDYQRRASDDLKNKVCARCAA